MRLLGKATFDLAKGRFLTFEPMALASRWGGTQLNGRRGDTDAAPIGMLFTRAADSPCERVAPAFNRHPVYRRSCRTDDDSASVGIPVRVILTHGQNAQASGQ